ncbi:hypothetical protein [Rhodococcus erythropolis]|uniref:Uncharacterized protein n=1 Tax=Rhodococcus erythropolis TaxID=1833 RepID=A0A8I0ZSX2_RHOER|nr:hypothetical protein [Rhodococcus erythropolis]MBH5145339.1 hypothetical protein [Rhodococcus erythropolis]
MAFPAVVRDSRVLYRRADRVSEWVLAAIAEHGFVLACGSALIDYDVVSHRTEGIDASNGRWRTGELSAIRHKILDVFHENGWCAEIVKDDDFDKHVLVDAGSGCPVVVQMSAERHTGGSVRLIFDDVVGGKGVAVATVARGRDLLDLANIFETPGWSLLRVEDAIRSIK